MTTSHGDLKDSEYLHKANACNAVNKLMVFSLKDEWITRATDTLENWPVEQNQE